MIKVTSDSGEEDDRSPSSVNSTARVLLNSYSDIGACEPPSECRWRKVCPPDIEAADSASAGSSGAEDADSRGDRTVSAHVGAPECAHGEGRPPADSAPDATIRAATVTTPLHVFGISTQLKRTSTAAAAQETLACPWRCQLVRLPPLGTPASMPRRPVPAAVAQSAARALIRAVNAATRPTGGRRGKMSAVAVCVPAPRRPLAFVSSFGSEAGAAPQAPLRFPASAGWTTRAPQGGCHTKRGVKPDVSWRAVVLCADDLQVAGVLPVVSASGFVDKFPPRCPPSPLALAVARRTQTTGGRTYLDEETRRQHLAPLWSSPGPALPPLSGSSSYLALQLAHALSRSGRVFVDVDARRSSWSAASEDPLWRRSDGDALPWTCVILACVHASRARFQREGEKSGRRSGAANSSASELSTSLSHDAATRLERQEPPPPFALPQSASAALPFLETIFPLPPGHSVDGQGGAGVEDCLSDISTVSSQDIGEQAACALEEESAETECDFMTACGSVVAEEGRDVEWRSLSEGANVFSETYPAGKDDVATWYAEEEQRDGGVRLRGDGGFTDSVRPIGHERGTSTEASRSDGWVLVAWSPRSRRPMTRSEGDARLRWRDRLENAGVSPPCKTLPRLLNQARSLGSEWWRRL
jgi:hypothetical protein